MEVIVNQEATESAVEKTAVFQDVSTVETQPGNIKRRRVGRRSKKELQQYREERARIEHGLFPHCRSHPDCHAWRDGRCIALVDNDFGGRDCPFYKNRDVNRIEQQECMEHLIKIGRADLIEKYKKSLLSLGIFDLADSYTDRAAEELDRYSEECLQELLSESAASNTPDSSEEDGDWDD